VFYVANDLSSKFLFQYSQENATIQQQNQIQNNFISIVLKDNIGDVVTNKRYSTSHCEWTGQPMFPQLDPLEVNKQIIHYVNNSMAVQPSVPNTICYYTDDQHYNCSIDELGPVYLGQTYDFKIIGMIHASNNAKRMIFRKTVENEYKRTCKSRSMNDHALPFLTTGICTKIQYKGVLYSDGQSCNIYLSGLVNTHTYSSAPLTTTHYFNDVYRLAILSCPLGFALNQILLICQCDPIIKTIVPSAESCNIDDQTILRPAGSWIMGRINTDNNYTYQVSSHCPFDYIFSTSLLTPQPLQS